MSFMMLSRQSFSTLLLILVMETFAVKFLLSAASGFPISPSDNLLQLRSRQGLVMVDLNNFLNLLKLFLAVARDFTKLL